MKEIKALTFDLGNVLIFVDWNSANHRLNQIEENLGDRTTQFLKDNTELIHNLETGKIDEDTFLNEIKSNVNSKLSKKELAKIYSDIFWENSELTKLLPYLKKNYKLYLLSNTNIIHRKYGWDKFEFIKHFDRLFLSYEIGYAKPEKEIYEFVISNIPYEKEELIYIDDIENFILTANSLGWNAVRFSSNEELIKEFLRFGIKCNNI